MRMEPLTPEPVNAYKATRRQGDDHNSCKKKYTGRQERRCNVKDHQMRSMSMGKPEYISAETVG
jgi:hypothetical protein